MNYDGSSEDFYGQEAKGVGCLKICRVTKRKLPETRTAESLAFQVS